MTTEQKRTFWKNHIDSWQHSGLSQPEYCKQHELKLANLYSLIETAKANQLEPYQYLRHIFAELPKAETIDQIEALLPWRVNLQPVVN